MSELYNIRTSSYILSYKGQDILEFSSEGIFLGSCISYVSDLSLEDKQKLFKEAIIYGKLNLVVTRGSLYLYTSDTNILAIDVIKDYFEVFSMK